MADGHFECKVSGRRESASGIFITLQLQPDDHTPELAMLRVGSALMIGWSEVVDTTVHNIEATPERSKAAVLEHKPRRPFNELKLSARAGIRCGDEQFSLFLMDVFPETAAKYTDPADVVRQLCGVTSRAELDTNFNAATEWRHIEDKYQDWLVTKKYKDSAR